MLAETHREELVYIEDQENRASSESRYLVVHRRALESIAEASRVRGASAKVATQSRSAALSEETTNQLAQVWRTMIRDARPPTPERNLATFPAQYEFSATFDLGGASASSMGPPPGSCPADLVAIGHKLADYADADPAHRLRLEEDLRERSASLQQRLARADRSIARAQ
jgi:hypothetical protein